MQLTLLNNPRTNILPVPSQNWFPASNIRIVKDNWFIKECIDEEEEAYVCIHVYQNLFPGHEKRPHGLKGIINAILRRKPSVTGKTETYFCLDLTSYEKNTNKY